MTACAAMLKQMKDNQSINQSILFFSSFNQFAFTATFNSTFGLQQQQREVNVIVFPDKTTFLMFQSASKWKTS